MLVLASVGEVCLVLYRVWLCVKQDELVEYMQPLRCFYYYQ